MSRDVRVHPRSKPMEKAEEQAIARHLGRDSLGFSLRFGPFELHSDGDGRGYLRINLTRRRYLIAGKTGIKARWSVRVDRQFDYRAKTTTDRCECGRWLELRGWTDWTLSQWLYCPSCRYRLKPGPMIAAAHAAREAAAANSHPQTGEDTA